MAKFNYEKLFDWLMEYYKFEFQDIKKYLETVEVWFGKSAELRKQELLGDNEEIQFDTDFE